MGTHKNHMVVSIMSFGFCDFWQSQRIYAENGEMVSSQALLQERREDTPGLIRPFEYPDTCGDWLTLVACCMLSMSH